MPGFELLRGSKNKERPQRMAKQCPKCDYIRKPEDSAPEWECPNCKAVYAKLEKAIKAGIDVRQPVHALSKPADQDLKRVILTTTPTLPFGEIQNVLDIVSTDYTYAFSSLNEFLGSIGRAIAGSGRSRGTESLLQQGRAEVLRSLRSIATRMGADAVVGVSIHVTEFSGATDNGIIVVTATGTAVTVKHLIGPPVDQKLPLGATGSNS